MSSGELLLQDEETHTGAQGIADRCTTEATINRGSSTASILSSPNKDSQAAATFGVPTAKKQISVADGFFTLGCFACFAAALATIESESLATELGQTNQLKIIGLLLSVMAYCTSTQIQLFLLFFEANSKKSSLQNFDGILRLSPATRQLSWVYRTALSLLFALPLALSVGYKSFVGGSSSSRAFGITGAFGATGPPGTQNIGFGLSLFVNASLQWFEDPGFNRTYGFNMHVASENATAMLDGPMPALVRELQSEMHSDESISISADVSAVVCELSDVLSESREWLNTTFAADITNNANEVAYEQFVYNTSFWLGLMNPEASNYGMVWMSWWSELQNQSFGSQVRQYNLARRKYRGTWTITPNLVTLTEATAIPDSTLNNQNVLAQNWLGALQLYVSSLTEFDWHFRQYGNSRYANNTKFVEFIRTDATLVCSMVWSRIVALNGPEVWMDASSVDPNLEYNVSTQAYVERTTMHRGWLLVILLAVNPALLTATLCLRASWLHHVPLSEGFGVISLLAGARPESLRVLHGAALSGKLSRTVGLRFFVRYSPDKSRGEISIDFDQRGRNAYLQNERIYS